MPNLDSAGFWCNTEACGIHCSSRLLDVAQAVLRVVRCSGPDLNNSSRFFYEQVIILATLKDLWKNISILGQECSKWYQTNRYSMKLAPKLTLYYNQTGETGIVLRGANTIYISNYTMGRVLFVNNCWCWWIRTWLAKISGTFWSDRTLFRIEKNGTWLADVIRFIIMTLVIFRNGNAKIYKKEIAYIISNCLQIKM